MTSEPDPITDEQLDAYFDGLMPPEQREAFEARLRAHPELCQELKLQERINASLQRLFPLEQISDQRLSELLQAALPTEPVARQKPDAGRHWTRRRMTRSVLAAGVALAAVLGWLLIDWQLRSDTTDTIFFEPRPLALVYQEAVNSGFEPYYECHEEDRFRATFFRRQGQELKLADLPEDSRMLGLSYPGGLSRDTTAMLCLVDEQPVMVCVDRLAHDSPLATKNQSGQIKVFRKVRDGLVFYEVTPFDSSRLIRYLATPQ